MRALATARQSPNPGSPASFPNKGAPKTRALALSWRKSLHQRAEKKFCLQKSIRSASSSPRSTCSTRAIENRTSTEFGVNGQHFAAVEDAKPFEPPGGFAQN